MTQTSDSPSSHVTFHADVVPLVGQAYSQGEVIASTPKPLTAEELGQWIAAHADSWAVKTRLADIEEGMVGGDAVSPTFEINVTCVIAA